MAYSPIEQGRLLTHRALARRRRPAWGDGRAGGARLGPAAGRRVRDSARGEARACAGEPARARYRPERAGLGRSRPRPHAAAAQTTAGNALERNRVGCVAIRHTGLAYRSRGCPFSWSGPRREADPAALRSPQTPSAESGCALERLTFRKHQLTVSYGLRNCTGGIGGPYAQAGIRAAQIGAATRSAPLRRACRSAVPRCRNISSLEGGGPGE